MTECRICGDAVKEEDTATLPDSRLCRDCMALKISAEHLMDKSPRKAIHYFTDLFMQARRRTKSREELENCIWEAWWNGHRNNCSNRI